MLSRSLEARKIIDDRRLAEHSAKGDGLELLTHHVDFEAFRRPPSDHVFMFKVVILQASHNHPDERTEYLIKDRQSFMRFLGLSLNGKVSDANTIWTFREALWRCVTCCARVVVVAGSAAGSRVLNLPFDRPVRPSELPHCLSGGIAITIG
jgi:transposase, IS5 family